MGKSNKKKLLVTPASSKTKAVAKTTKPSPDSVVCIDLTDSNGQDFADRPGKERRLGTVRKEVGSASSSAVQRKRGGLKTTGLENADDCDEVIIIDSDDDSSSIGVSGEDGDCAIVDVDNAGTAAVASRPSKKARVKKEENPSLSPGRKQSENEDDDEMDIEGVEIIQGMAPKLAAATMVAEAPNNTSADEDVVVEGVINETRLPHMRQHCTRFPFKATHQNEYGQNMFSLNKANSQSCDLCYCYVCDCPVKDCQHWHSSTSVAPENNHCCASDKDYSWERMRYRAKQKGLATRTDSEDSEIGRTGDDRPPPGYHFMQDCPDYGWGWSCEDCWCDNCDSMATYACWNENCTDPRTKLSTFQKPGPFQPDNQDAPRDSGLTKCRHCSWYVRLEVGRRHPSSRDWCAHCGRVASEDDLEKQQVNSTDDKVDQIEGSDFLGQKEIPFRIKAHDPRLFEKYKENWEEDDGFGSSGWNYDDAEREEEVFLHRLGKSPNFRNIINSIPQVANENIPTTFDKDGSYPSGIDDWKVQDATDAVIIEDPEQLQFVYLTASIGKLRRENNDIEVNASWDKESRQGVFKIRFLLPKEVFLGQNNSTRPSDIPDYFPLLLGLWFGIFPLRPSEVCGLLDASSSEEIIDDLREGNYGSFKYTERFGRYDIPIKPYIVELDNVIDDLREKLPSLMGSILSAKNANESRLRLASSDACRFSGGVCSPASSDSFRDSIVRYFSEQFLSLINTENQSIGEDLISSCIGAIRGNSFRTLDAILGFQTAATAKACFFNDSENNSYKLKYLYGRPLSIEETMIGLENLGHESEDCVEGLKIELLDFQRQSLKWALEREKQIGGVQSFIWPKLPSRGEGQEDLYYNPILKQFRKDKPALVRGGFIAEQMGLGKTVISLALILKNPAPDFPLSGDTISAMKKKDPPNVTSKDCGWEKDLYEKTSKKNKKTGSVICKGTLVICPVSLVGQWIDEARSKLKEPGLIYPYHGPNRKRNPYKLAANSIVVTTYAVLASDASHHAKKAQIGSNYCPPLEQIRWWRIICDEGHSLRQSNTQRSKSVLSLVADHKWIVSGTPMNTSHLDLKNQLKFLGFEHVEKLFKKLSRHRSKNAKSELLMYFLRPIMMRHSQEQKYRGTSTTLMSLPPKTERKQLVRFNAKEKKEFGKIEKEAQDWYIKFRAANLGKIPKHFLKISSKLTPLRIACSGGKYPIYPEKFDEENDVDIGTDTMNIDTDVDESREKKKPAKKNLTAKAVYSKFTFNSKFKELIAHLKKIRDKEPDSKSLVFSQFSSTLDWLKVELPKHGFQFRTLSGDMSMKKRAKALSEFQNDPPTTIFLLSMRAGAVGINLTQANRVFLMEPSFNPALEAQAIGRIHRLGQKRPVEIVRLVVKNSVEENMVDLLEKKYGKSSKNTPEVASGNDQKIDASDKKIVATDDSKNCNGIAGNLTTDKAQLVAEEFDTLFGVKDRLSGV